ncbi:MAG: rod shape-determining protein MreD [Bacteroides sp.]|nr:rod shape-determining protein MreD [Bacteroides sp.]MCM1379077.1 rod shape-determining protein MreD [Bacteroides sp.]MCM1445775.1 rod shape-determining protein MreD [Prevotella sp.]
MSKTFLQLALLFIVLVLTQVVIFNHIVLFSIGLAFVFIYFIIKLPVNLSPAKVIALSFLLGLVIDIFQDTPGVNALACTCLGGARRTIMRLYIPREEDIQHSIPSIRTLGAGVYAKYVLTMTFVYCLLLFLIEAFTFFNPMILIARVVASTLLTSVLLIALDSLALPSRSEKRL